GALYYFMDQETYEQIPLEKDMVEDALNFMKENDMATINFYKGKPFRVTPQNFVELEVTETEPGVKGDTSSGGSKPATVETGYT
ncbi:MAG: elongation factor P, partial [Peptoniphilus grossensis]